MATAQFLWIHEVSFDFLMSYDKRFLHTRAPKMCSVTSPRSANGHTLLRLALKVPHRTIN